MKLKSKRILNYKGPVFDLSIKSDDHSYNVEGLTTHNSAAGSFVAYLLSVTSLDPIEHDLLFERFINEHRKVMCLTENNFVALKNGSMVKVNELTMQHKNDIKTINNNELLLINTNEVDEEVYIIEDDYGRKLELTGEHIIPIIRNGKQIEIKVMDLLETDQLL